MFREFGINKRLPDDIIEKLKEQLKISDYKYIIPAEGDVFAEIINHNDDEWQIQWQPKKSWNK